LFNTKKFAALAVVASGFMSTTASADYLTFTTKVTFSNPFSAESDASVTAVGSDATFQTTDIGSDGPDGWFNQVKFLHSESTSPNNAGLGTTIGLGRNYVIPYEEVVQNVGFDFAFSLNFNQYSDVALTMLTGTGTSTVTGHAGGTMGYYGGHITATFDLASQLFSTGSKTYSLSNFQYTAGDADNSGGIAAFVKEVPAAPAVGTPLPSTAVAGATLLTALAGTRRRRAAARVAAD
jgi:hypothetical protein